MSMSEGSDSEDADFSLPPERALQQLKALLQAERGLDHHARVVKKRKLSSHLSNSSTWPEARDNDQNAPGKGQRTNGKVDTPEIDRALAGLEGEDALPSDTVDRMQQHFSRELDDASIAELGSQRWVAGQSPAFQAAWPAAAWYTTGLPLPTVERSLAKYGIRPRLSSLWQKHHKDLSADFASAQQQCLFALMRSYKDIMHTEYDYATRLDSDDEVLEAALLHSLEHVAATAQRIKKNNDALKAQPEMEVPQDQGFTRPKVLLLLPMRNAAFKAVLCLLKLAQKETRSDSVQNKARFLEEFGPLEEEQEERRPGQPAEHAVLFSGNIDDHFMLGIKLTRGAVKLYADFYQSDIIVASPVALATKQTDADSQTLQDLAFLSSIEVLVAARCDVFQMQNWAHVISVLESLNRIPRESRNVDMMRVQQLYLDGRASSFRQNILLASFASPELNALFTSKCSSHAGKAKLQALHQGVLAELSCPPSRQMFERFRVTALSQEPEQRLAYFKTHVWPRIRDSGAIGQMIFVSSYYDYLRLRSLLRAEGVEFEALTEYASGSEVARGRSRFAAGKTRLALYTERAHFYHRQRTRGIRVSNYFSILFFELLGLCLQRACDRGSGILSIVQDIFMYQLPQHPIFYKELAHQLSTDDLQEKGQTTMSTLFSKLDASRLERVVGSSRAKRMLVGKSGTYLFC